MWQQVEEEPQQTASEGTTATCSLSLYRQPPDRLVSIEEFETLALDRLKVLKGIEDDGARGISQIQRQERAKALIRKHLWSKDTEEAQAKDIISHFVLRLAYCRTQTLRQWFLTQETNLFRFRFNLETSSGQAAFLHTHETELPYKSITSEELEELKQQLIQVLMLQNQKDAAAELARNPDPDIYHRVPWEQVPDLIATRKAVLKAGNAYVHRRDMSFIVANHFKVHLSRALSLTARKWIGHLAAQEEERLTPIVEGLSQRYLGPDFSGDENATKDTITCGQLPALAARSFPLCMQHMYEGLRREHHLRHTARQQLGLFLKGIGLPLEEAMKFWRTEFAPKTPAEKFDKEYAYNVRHNYGKEGKRADYTPYTCIKIVASAPGAGEYHGCPYKTFSTERLSARLAQMRIDSHIASQVVAKARDGHYQLACGLTFEGQNQCSCDTGINHPNQYFVESQKAIAAKNPENLGSSGVLQPDKGGTEPMQM